MDPEPPPPVPEASLGQLLLGRGEIGRRRFALWGLGLVALKWNLDRLIGALFFDQAWAWSWRRMAGLYLWQSPDGTWDTGWLVALGVMSVPFLYVGTMLTLGRLRSAGMSGFWVLLFVVPAVKLVFFAVLCAVPGWRVARSLTEPAWLRWVPEGRVGSATVAVGLAGVMAVGATWLAAEVWKDYGWALFVGTPFVLGFVATAIHSARRERTLLESVGVTLVALALGGVGLLAVAMEGVICLVMAAPLAVLIGCTGSMVAWALRRSLGAGMWTSGQACWVALILPGTMGLEAWLPPASPVRPVRTEVIVDAPPDRVWRHVVSFSELPPPTELLFRLGIAHPVRAEMHGTGVGAVRRCHFSTGPFVEPITVWDEGRRLAFRVESNPAPMQEWTPYPEVHPPHLEGHFVSREGEFLLEPLPGGRTRLVGTTWYEHHLWPDSYWRLWSDAIIHTIHGRVLRHVKALSETEAR